MGKGICETSDQVGLDLSVADNCCEEFYSVYCFRRQHPPLNMELQGGNDVPRRSESHVGAKSREASGDISQM